MFKELIQSLDKNLEVSAGADSWSSSEELYEVEISGNSNNIQLRKLLASKLLLKDAPLHTFRTGYNFSINIQVKLGEEFKLYEAIEEVVGEIKCEGKSIDDIFERIDELSTDECKVLFKKIMGILF